MGKEVAMKRLLSFSQGGSCCSRWPERGLPQGRKLLLALAAAGAAFGITLLFGDAEPGRGPALHRHPYAEVLIVQQAGGRPHA
jgi:hypothetical protein